MSNQWFEVSKAGLAKILERRGKEFAVFELAQNAWDEPGVTQVNITLTPLGSGLTQLVVEDDAPDGFKDLAHAYTLFAESAKKQNTGQRGRFNLGEKLVFALARTAKIITTTGGIRFDDTGRHRLMERRERGSKIHAVIRMRKDEVEAVLQHAKRLIPPPGIVTHMEGVELIAPDFPLSFESVLPTEAAGEDGMLVRTSRRAVVNAYRIDHDHPAAIYEMGIPVCELDGEWLFDVQQKIPLTLDRENVLESFKKALALAAFNALHARMDVAAMNTTWAKTAVESPDASPEAVKDFVTQRFGERAVAYDPSDPEANKRAVAAGYAVVTGGALSGAAWQQVRAVVLPAGRVTPSPKPYGEGGKPLTPAVVTEGMREVGLYARHVARLVLGAEISVVFVSEISWPFAATYGPSCVQGLDGRLTFNVGRLGKAWFSLLGNREAIDDLLIHEFGHHFESDHLSTDYYKALTRIASKWIQLARSGTL